MKPTLVELEAAAAHLHVSTRTIQRLIEHGKIRRWQNDNGTSLVALEDLERLIDNPPRNARSSDQVRRHLTRKYGHDA